MAEVLLSPGVLARETDSSFISGQPVQAGAAILGPTVKGPVGIPTVVSSYSDYQNRFGAIVESGSAEYTYFTSISAYNYFQQGGDSLLVTRVVSGSYTSANSTAIPNNVESGEVAVATNLFPSLTTPVLGQGTGTFSSIETTSSLSGTGVDLDITITENGKLAVLADELLGSITVNPVDCVDLTYNDVVLAGAPGSGAKATVVVSGNTITSITVTTQGSNYILGETVTIAAESLGVGSGAATIVLQSSDIDRVITAAVVGQVGSGYVVGETLTVNKANIGNSDVDAVFTLDAGDIVNQSAFVLETLSEGSIMNSVGATGSNGTLVNGTKDNLRWEIVSPNSASGTFNLLIRRGDDTTTSRTILETWTGLSLDPNSNNYIEKIIGNSKQVVTQDPSSNEYYIADQGSFNTKSNFVRVKSVASKTLNYFDNDGVAKAAYTASIPQAGQGEFSGAQGTAFNPKVANFYENINSSNTQGLVADNYSISLQLLANRDAFRYNLITAPGLYDKDYAGPISTMINNATFRGDNIAVIDGVRYGIGINSVIEQAAGRDTSYAASYWPWLQTIDPDLGSLVWVPASTMMPGVYAFNDRAGEAWFAPAGLNRGGLGTVVRAERKLTNGNRDDLYQDNVNPIATFPNTGVVVFGQKTMQKKASALDRVNVRRLLIALKNYISQIADNLVFEANTIATRNNFLTQVNPYLESVQQRQGLYAFKVVMDESNNTPDVIDRNQLIGQIYLQPTKTAEFIYLDFNILPTGATFPV